MMPHGLGKDGKTWYNDTMYAGKGTAARRSAGRLPRLLAWHGQEKASPRGGALVLMAGLEPARQRGKGF